jgi:hypothetical protein
MGNITIKTELDLVIEESGENIIKIKKPTMIDSIIAHAKAEVKNSWEPVQDKHAHKIDILKKAQPEWKP